MPFMIRATRIMGAGAALCLLVLLSVLLADNFRFTADFFLQQFVPVYLPSVALLVLLLLPFSRIRNASAWKALFFAMVVLSLVWIVPVAYRTLTSPSFGVDQPRGEIPAPRIVIKRSYNELGAVTLLAGLFATQILAIWYARQRAPGTAGA